MKYLGVLGLVLLGTRIVAPAAAQVEFERFEIDTGVARGQTLVSGHFLGGAIADLATVSVDEAGTARLSVYALGDRAWEQRIEAPLEPEVQFVDVARIGGRDRVIAYAPGRLIWFDPDSATHHLLMEVTASFNGSPSGLYYAGAESREPFDEGEIPRVDISRDLNHDGRDDLILPAVDGFWVLVQTIDGRFADPVKLGPPEPFREATAFGAKRRYGEVGPSPLTAPWYLSRVHQMDHDGDGRSDLVFWNEDHFDVHHQTAQGSFEPTAESFTTEVPFDSDGVYSLVFGLSEASPFRLFFGLRRSTKRTVLHSLQDLNDDGVADLVTLSIEGRSILRQRSSYEVHFGARTADGVSFAPEAGAVVRPRAKAPPGYSFAQLQDFNGDGRLDLGSATVRTGFDKMIRAMLNTSVSFSFELYLLEDGVYPDRPTAKRRFKSDIDVRGGRDAGFWPPVLTGDVDGDGSSDLMVGKNREELHLFLGGPDFLGVPQKVAVGLPGDERNSWLTDLDRDGRQDLLLHHRSATEPNRLTVLIAR